MSLDAPAIELFRSDEDNVIVVYKNVVCQVRRGHLTADALETMASSVRAVLSRQPGPAGGLIVLEPTAIVPEGPTRARQMRLIGDVLRTQRTFATVVVTNEGPQGMLMRAFGRLVSAGQPRLAVHGTTHAGAAWLAEHLPPRRGEELEALIEWMRGRQCLPGR